VAAGTETEAVVAVMIGMVEIAETETMVMKVAEIA
jgi:hypothetical protein